MELLVRRMYYLFICTKSILNFTMNIIQCFSNYGKKGYALKRVRIIINPIQSTSIYHRRIAHTKAWEQKLPIGQRNTAPASRNPPTSGQYKCTVKYYKLVRYSAKTFCFYRLYKQFPVIFSCKTTVH
jgi:hypothetical protein